MGTHAVEHVVVAPIGGMKILAGTVGYAASTQGATVFDRNMGLTSVAREANGIYTIIFPAFTAVPIVTATVTGDVHGSVATVHSTTQTSVKIEVANAGGSRVSQNFSVIVIGLE